MEFLFSPKRSPLFKQNMKAITFAYFSFLIPVIFKIGRFCDAQLAAKALAVGATKWTPLFPGGDPSSLILNAVVLFAGSVLFSRIRFWSTMAHVEYQDYEAPGTPTKKRWMLLSAAKRIRGRIIIFETFDRHSSFVAYGSFCLGALLMLFGVGRMFWDANTGISFYKVFATILALMGCGMIIGTVANHWNFLYAVDLDRTEVTVGEEE
jgi:hypothetical protein